MSSFAGNPLLISPGSLISDGLTQASDAQSHFSGDAVDYDRFAELTVRLVADACGAVGLFNAIAGTCSDAF